MAKLKELTKNKTFIIAEISANHGNDIQIVKDSIKAAKNIGCDAVKIQTYTPDTITLDCDNEYFQINNGTIWDGTTLYKLYEKAYLPWEWHEELFLYARSIGAILFSTPFDFKAVDLLEKCQNPIYKIASFEITDIPLIKYAAEKGKPMIISTGIATKNEIQEAVETCQKAGNEEIYLLKCTSQYPAKLEDANLNTMVDMKKSFGVEVGLSDHTKGVIVPVTATAMGAKIIEKHFIMDKSIESPDNSFSMDFSEFKDLVLQVRNTEKILGKVTYDMDDAKLASRKYARSLFVVKDVKKGDKITAENIKSIRPADGMEPKHYEEILGGIFSCDVKRGTPFSKNMYKI